MGSDRDLGLYCIASLAYNFFMARPWRIQYEDAVYHVSVRGNHRQDIFRDDSDRAHLLSLFGRAAERFKIEILSFCLMDNHYHLFLRTPEANLSKAMHWINCAYTVYYNLRRKTIGHLFQGRFKSVVVIDDTHYLHLSMYIHSNPVRAGMVEDPVDYEWSSYRDYVEKNSRFAWLRRDDLLEYYGSRRNRRSQYQRESQSMINKEPAFLEQLRHGVIIGSTEKLKELVEKYLPAGDRKEVTKYTASRKAGLSAEKEIARVAGIFGADLKTIMQRHRNNPAKLAAYYHLVEHCGMSVKQVSGLLGVSTGAVSHGIKRFRTMPEFSKTAKLKA